MAVTQITNLITKPEFAARVQQLSLMRSALFQSGIIATDPAIAALARSEGATFSLPFWNDISGSSAVGSDDPAANLTPGNIDMGKEIAIKLFRAGAWAAMDITKSYAGGDDPLERIAGLIAAWWTRDQQTTLIRILTGVLADNAANDSGDMIKSVATDAASASTAAEKISASLILDAKQTMGDAAGGLTALCLHSALLTELQKQNLISYIPNDKANVGFGTYLGYSILVDDDCPAVAGTNRTTYTSYLFGTGAVAYGEGAPKVPAAYQRSELTGNGMGQETLVSRREFILHPRGLKWTGSSMAGSSPTNTELAMAANWDRVLPRKKIPFVALKTNG